MIVHVYITCYAVSLIRLMDIHVLLCLHYAKYVSGSAKTCQIVDKLRANGHFVCIQHFINIAFPP